MGVGNAGRSKYSRCVVGERMICQRADEIGKWGW